MEIADVLKSFNDFLNQSLWFRAFKFVLGFYLIIMLATIILIFFRMIKRHSYLKLLFSGQEFENIKPEFFQSRWEKINNLLKGDNENEWKAAVLETSTMLDEVLKTIGYKDGNTLGQRLQNMAPEQLSNLEEVKKANDVKNEIVRNSGYKLSKKEAEELVDAFGEALKFFEAVS